MAFGSQNGRSNGGFGSNNGNSFGFNSNNQGGTGFSGNSNNFFGGSQSSSGNNSGFGNNSSSSFGNGSTQQTNTSAPTNIPQSNQGKTSVPLSNNTVPNSPIKSSYSQCIRGRISQYRTCSDKTGNYRRLLPRKIYQALVYGQRFEDLLHSFIVTEITGYDNAGNPIQQRYVVNVHGSTNYGATLVDNEEVEVRGKFTPDNIMMARDIKVINGNIATPIKFQRSVKLIAIMCLVIAFLVLGIIGFASMGSGNSISGFMNNVWSFVTTMFVVYVILLIMYVVFSFTRVGFMARLLAGNRKSSPLISMLIMAFFLTLLLYNAFGVGTMVASTLSGALSAVGPIIVMIIGIVILLKAFK